MTQTTTWLLFTILYPSLQLIAFGCCVIVLQDLTMRKVKNIGTQFGQILVICIALYHLTLISRSLLDQLLPLPPYGPDRGPLIYNLCYISYYHIDLTVASCCILSGIFFYVNLVIELLKNGFLITPPFIVALFTSKRLVYSLMTCMVLAVCIGLAVDSASISVVIVIYGLIQALGLPILVISCVLLVITVLHLLGMRKTSDSRRLVLSILRLLTASAILFLIMLLGLTKSIMVIKSKSDSVAFSVDPSSFQSSYVIYFFLGPAMLLIFRTAKVAKKSEKSVTTSATDAKKSFTLNSNIESSN